MIDDEDEEFPSEKLMHKYTDKFNLENYKIGFTHLYLLLANQKMSSKLENYFYNFNITMSQFTLILILYSDRKPQETPTSLAKKMQVTKSNIIGILKSLKKKEFIYTEVNEEDRRSYGVFLSKAGREFFEEMIPKHYKEITKIFGSFKEDELDEIMRLMKKIILILDLM